MKPCPTSLLVMTSMAAAIAAALLACTTETKLISGPPQAPDAGDVSDEQVEDAAQPPKPDGLGFGATCKGSFECRTGLSCTVFPGATRGYCAATCGDGKACPKAEGECINLGVCAPSCGDGCPTDTDCYKGSCIPSCINRKDICGSGGSCTPVDNVSICIGDDPLPPPAGTCTTPTTTAASGVSPAKTIAATTTTEKGTLCDWQNGRLGGYGCMTKCDGGVSTTNKLDQAACKATMKATCTATVAQFEACVAAMAASRCDVAGALAGACKPLVDRPGCM